MAHWKVVVAAVFAALVAAICAVPVAARSDVPLPPLVAEVWVIDGQATASWLAGDVTYAVRLKRPLEPEEIDALGRELMEVLPRGLRLRLKFVLDQWPRPWADPAAAELFYAWRFFYDQETVSATFNGLSPSQGETVIEQYRLAPGERIERAWVDHYQPHGVVALIRSGRELHFAQLKTGQRWVVKGRRSKNGETFTATHKIDGAKRYKADGNDADTLRFDVRPDGALWQYWGAERRPWLVATSFPLPESAAITAVGTSPGSRP